MALPLYFHLCVEKNSLKKRAVLGQGSQKRADSHTEQHQGESTHSSETVQLFQSRWLTSQAQELMDGL